MGFSRRQFIQASVAGAAVTALPACSGEGVELDLQQRACVERGSPVRAHAVVVELLRQRPGEGVAFDPAQSLGRIADYGGGMPLAWEVQRRLVGWR